MAFTDPKTPLHSLALSGGADEDIEQFIIDAGVTPSADIVHDFRIALASILNISDYNAYSVQDLWRRYQLAGYPDPVQRFNLGPEIKGSRSGTLVNVAADTTTSVDIYPAESGDLILCCVSAGQAYTNFTYPTGTLVADWSQTLNGCGIILGYRYATGNETTFDIRTDGFTRTGAYVVYTIRNVLAAGDGGPFATTPLATHVNSQADMNSLSSVNPAPSFASTGDMAMSLMFFGADESTWANPAFTTAGSGAANWMNRSGGTDQFSGSYAIANGTDDASIGSFWYYNLREGNKSSGACGTFNCNPGSAGPTDGWKGAVILGATTDYTYIDVLRDQCIIHLDPKEDGISGTITNRAIGGVTPSVVGGTAIIAGTYGASNNNPRIFNYDTDDAVIFDGTGTGYEDLCLSGHNYTIEFVNDPQTQTGTDYCYMSGVTSGEYQLGSYYVTSTTDIFTGESTSGTGFTWSDAWLNTSGGWQELVQMSGAGLTRCGYGNEEIGSITMTGAATQRDDPIHPLTDAADFVLFSNTNPPGVTTWSSGGCSWFRVTRGMRYNFKDGQQFTHKDNPISHNQTLANTPTRPVPGASVESQMNVLNTQTHSVTLPTASVGDTFILVRGADVANFTNFGCDTDGWTHVTEFDANESGATGMEVYTKVKAEGDTAVEFTNTTGLPENHSVVILAVAGCTPEIFDGFADTVTYVNDATPVPANMGGFSRGSIWLFGGVAGNGGCWTTTAPKILPDMNVTVTSGTAAGQVGAWLGWCIGSELGGTNIGNQAGNTHAVDLDLGNSVSPETCHFGTGLARKGGALG